MPERGYDYEALQAEIEALPYGLTPARDLSSEMRRYVRERFELGKEEIDREGVKPGRIPGTRCVANGYTALLGVWHYYAGRKGLQSAIHPDAVWMATLKNNPLVRIEQRR